MTCFQQTTIAAAGKESVNPLSAGYLINMDYSS